jgi:uncharacterized damage-inducible protein DinB
MRSSKLVTLAALLAVLIAPMHLHAQAPTSGWRAEFLNSFSGAERKYLALAEAMPWEKYSWRPAQGVRSVCEVFLHIAGANYGLVGPLGAAPPASVDLRNIEKCPADKNQVLATMRASFAFARSAVTATTDAQADNAISIFGMNMTKRGLLLFIAEHAGEHLGQSIAYARTNGVVPPWSASQ